MIINSKREELLVSLLSDKLPERYHFSAHTADLDFKQVVEKYLETKKLGLKMFERYSQFMETQIPAYMQPAVLKTFDEFADSMNNAK